MTRIHAKLLLAYLSLALLAAAGCDYTIDISKLLPAPPKPVYGCRDGADIELPAGQCSSTPAATVRTCSDPDGDWTLVIPVERGVVQTAIEIAVATPSSATAAAAAIDWVADDDIGNIAGFAVSVSPQSPVVKRSGAEWAAEIVRRIQTPNAFNEVRIRSLGLSTTSHDAHELVVGTELQLGKIGGSKTELSGIRNRLYPLLLDLNVEQVRNLPTRPDKQSDAFKLVFATLVRPDGRVIVTGGVATLENYGSSYSKARIRVDSLASASFVGGLKAKTTARCEVLGFKQPFRQGGKVDLLWLVDGSDHGTGPSCSMYDIRNQFHRAAPTAWTRVTALGLDLWQAVAGMDQHLDGLLCSSDKGKGRFWGADGLTDLQPCLLFPSKTADPSTLESHGLRSVKQTLANLLPRATGDPHFLRQGARTALLFLTNREDHDVVRAFGEPAKGATVPHPLTAADRQKILDLPLMKDLVTLLRTSPNSGSGLAGTTPLALIAEPTADCGTQRGVGYAVLSEELGEGSQDLICQDDDGAEDRLRQVVDDLAARMSALTLRHDPAAFSLGVTLNGAPLFHSHTAGFDLARGVDHLGHRRALLLFGLASKLTPTNTLEVSYVGW